MRIDQARLRQRLTDRLDFAELKDLTFDLGIAYETLPHATSSELARELISHLAQRGRLGEMIESLRQRRGDVAWEEVIDTAVPPAPPAEAAPREMVAHAEAVDAIATLAREGRLALFLGADLPEAEAGVPSREQLAAGLATQAGLTPGPRLAAVAQQVMRHGNRFAFTDYLLRALEGGSTHPGPLFTALARLVGATRPELIVSAAPHRALESALRQQGVAVNVVTRDSAMRFVDPRRPTLLKLYGDIEQPETLVVTEQDQSALLLGGEKAQMVAEMRRAFWRSSLLFLGYDLQDPAVSALFDQVAGDRFQMRSFAAWPGLAPSEAAAFESNRGLTVLPLSSLALTEAVLARLDESG